jgi:hypothetical protein
MQIMPCGHLSAHCAWPSCSFPLQGRTSAREKAEAALRQSEIDRRARFENAVAKGNWASAMLKPGAQVRELEIRLAFNETLCITFQGDIR